jgi:hypothetical protein
MKAKSDTNWILVAVAYSLALPRLVVWYLIRLVRYVGILRLSVTSSVACAYCCQQISLVGLWRFQCGFTYAGHLLRPCPICHRLPKIVRCFHCGVTTKLI